MTVIRRYKKICDGVSIGDAQKVVASLEAVSSPCPGTVIDLSVDEGSPSYAAENDEYMANKGFEFVAQNPAQTLAEAAFAVIPLLDEVAAQDHGDVSGPVVLAMNTSLTQKMTLTGSLSASDISITLPPGPRKVTLEIVQGGAGAFAIPASAWPASAKFGSKGAPTFGDAAGAIRFVVLDFRGGTSVYVHYDTNVF